MNSPGNLRIGELLVQDGIITAEHLKEACELLAHQEGQGKTLGQILVEKGWIGEAALSEALGRQLGVPRIDPDVSLIDRKLLEGMSEAFLRRNGVLPAFKHGDILTLIMADPSDAATIWNLERHFGCKIDPAIAPAGEIQSAITDCFQRVDLSLGLAPPRRDKDLIIGQTNVSKERGDNVFDVVNYIISNAILEGASDIHIEPQDKSCHVRYRIDGILHHKSDLPLFLVPGVVSRIKVLCGLDITERRRHQDGRIEARVMNEEVDLRVSTYAAVHGESVVIRILHRVSPLVHLDALGFLPVNRSRFQKMIDHPSGIILVTGPTGSGKTTTLYASINYLNSLGRKIITVEDPVEYTIEGVVQGQFNPKLGLSYSYFLKSMMRQDPDVLMLGEVRDQEAAEGVIQAALTGHQVLSTFHTDDTTGALLRLMDMGIESFLISSTVVSVLSQRLVRVLCPHCREAFRPEPRLVASFNIQPTGLDKFTLYRPKGCPRCRGVGFKGRTAIHELLLVNDAIRDAIVARVPSNQIRLIARNRAHLISLLEDGFYKATQGVTSLEEILRVAFYNESDELSARSTEEIVALCEGEDALISPQDTLPTIRKRTLQEEDEVLILASRFASRADRAQETASSEKPPNQKPALLVVEDDPVTAAVIEGLLEGHGYEVSVAEDGIEAFLQLGKKEFDLILSDINMPNMDGFKLLELMHQKGIETPVIFLTAETQAEKELRGFELGALDYIKKPIQKDVLLFRVKNVLNKLSKEEARST